MNKGVELFARSAMSLLFLISGAQKVIAPARMAPLFAALGLPTWSGLPIGVFEVAAAMAFVVGFKIRVVAWMLSIWCVLTAFVGHRFWIDPMQLPSFLKNVGLAGAFILFAIPGTLPVSRRQDDE